MPRRPRIEFPDALYHLTSRGDRRESIFNDADDRHALLSLIASGVDRFDLVCHAYCLMENHFHLVAQTREANLSRFMRYVNGTYTQRYNRRHAKVGHVFQGRYAAVLVDRDAYFLAVCRYVDLNPVRAGLVTTPRDWPWSSYRAHVGLAPRPAWLSSAPLYTQLASHAPISTGPDAYASFVAEGTSQPLWDKAARQRVVVLGNNVFQQRCAAAAAEFALRDGADQVAADPGAL